MRVWKAEVGQWQRGSLVCLIALGVGIQLWGGCLAPGRRAALNCGVGLARPPLVFSQTRLTPPPRKSRVFSGSAQGQSQDKEVEMEAGWAPGPLVAGTGLAPAGRQPTSSRGLWGCTGAAPTSPGLPRESWWAFPSVDLESGPWSCRYWSFSSVHFSRL